MRLIARTLQIAESPIGTAHALLKGYQGLRPILDLSQGTPNYAPATAISNHVAAVAHASDGGDYTARPGLDKLRRLVAAEVSEDYRGDVRADQVLITGGCNQAFCCAISALADSGDEVILAAPFYFNHDMWMRLDHITPVYLQPGPGFIPDPEAADRLVTNRTRAIVLVTPGNPTGITIPPEIIHRFATMAAEHKIVLILDETYRVFRAVDEPPHRLFSRPSWEESVVSLHSFSKEFAIPGYRTGAAIAHPSLIVEMTKPFECMAICAPRLGQEAVIAGLTFAKDWRRDRVEEIRARQRRFEAVLETRPGGFELCASGAFYGWVKYPALGLSANEVVRKLAIDHGVLALSGNIFTPSDSQYLRFSFGNVSVTEIDELGERLRAFEY